MCSEMRASRQSTDTAEARSRSIILNSIAAQRLDQTRLGRGQLLREHGEITVASRCDPERRVHINADDVPARREPQLALAGEKDIPGLVLLPAAQVKACSR